ncbi:E3 ubiquitin-protein ligase Midline-1-like [Polypterus senegalus]|uniref:E3 ubiquitin-protein ligase Midline-1-like n=1 Tax=Polypterus senegalus TaxID=55291 RepID=UPI0019667DDB|nr:E3 ubiquitin-protein ligase Midline-1-like [Polypterus senegalus]
MADISDYEDLKTDCGEEEQPRHKVRAETMAEALLFVSQDDYTCSICLETLTDPIAIPCGDSFCMQCLTDYWDLRQECRCPQCRRIFTTRLELHINAVVNEVVKKIKKQTLSPLLSPNNADPGDLECDICTGETSRAVKSCLTCMVSYCQLHLQSHFKIATLKDHKLTDPVRNLTEVICDKHQKSLEIFCKTDKTYICVMCVVYEHNGHVMAELERERKEQEKVLEATQREIRRRVQKSKKKQKKIRRAVKQMNISLENEVEEHKKSFTDLICGLKETQEKLIEKFRAQKKMEMEKAEEVTERLERDIKELECKGAELRKLSETKDHIRFLQTFSCRCFLPAEGDSLHFNVTVKFSSEHLRKELSCIKKSLEKISQWDITTLTSGRVTPIFTFQTSEPRRREEFLKYFCPLKLDINTASRNLHLSEGSKKVTCKETETEYPYHPERFNSCPQVLCREALIGTRYYWEVKCTGNYKRIGVTYKEEGDECGLGDNEKSWCLLCDNSYVSVKHNDEGTSVDVPCNPRIAFRIMGDKYRVSEKLADDSCTIEESLPASKADGDKG